MANYSNPNGFRPVKFMGGSAWNGAMETFFVPASDATAIGVGDPVKISGLADANGVRAVTKAAPGDAICGTMVEGQYNPANLNTPNYRLPSTASYIVVCTDPNTIYEAEVSGTVGVADVGLNVNHVDASGPSTATGQSRATVDGTTKATTATLTFKIIEVNQKVGNDGTQPSARVLVKINNHQLAGGTGTLGIA